MPSLFTTKQVIRCMLLVANQSPLISNLQMELLHKMGMSISKFLLLFLSVFTIFNQTLPDSISMDVFVAYIGLVLELL